MIDSRGAVVAAWSTSTYRLMLLAYPRAFRCEFGDSMAQVFGDAVRDAWNGAGPAGVALLWMRTLADVARSLVGAYAAEKRDGTFRMAAALLILYACALAGTVGYGALRFGEFYEPPAFTRFGAPEAGEDALVAAHEREMGGAFGAYRSFTVTAGLSLAVLLGIACGLFGLWQRSVLHGAAALGTGLAVTIAAFELLPAIWFPLDRYPVGALWMMGGAAPVAAASWIASMLLGGLGSGRLRLGHH